MHPAYFRSRRTIVLCCFYWKVRALPIVLDSPSSCNMECSRLCCWSTSSAFSSITSWNRTWTNNKNKGRKSGSFLCKEIIHPKPCWGKFRCTLFSTSNTAQGWASLLYFEKHPWGTVKQISFMNWMLPKASKQTVVQPKPEQLSRCLSQSCAFDLEFSRQAQLRDGGNIPTHNDALFF